MWVWWLVVLGICSGVTEATYDVNVVLSRGADARKTRMAQALCTARGRRLIERCHLHIADSASAPFLKPAATPATTESNINDVYALTQAQQEAFWLFRVCHTSELKRRGAGILSRAMSFNEFLAEENGRRLRWVDRTMRFVWLNYARYAFGAPEMDPRTAQISRGEWASEPMFILDNLDTLFMSPSLRHNAFWDAVRWIEVVAVIEEALAGKSYYLTLREHFIGTSSTCPMTRLRPLVRAVVTAETSDGLDRAEKELADLLDLCLPPIATADRPLVSNTLVQLQTIRRFKESLPSFHREQRLVSFFEVTIRAFGGLLSAYALSGHPILLYRAWDLGHRLSYNLFRCAVRDSEDGNATASASPCLQVDALHNPCLITRNLNLQSWHSANDFPEFDYLDTVMSTAAVVGSNQLEFRTLSDLTGICDYGVIADGILHRLLSAARTVDTGLMPIHIAQNLNGTFSFGDQYTLGAESDSFYEYLVKSAIQLSESCANTNIWSQITPTPSATRPSELSLARRRCLSPATVLVWMMTEVVRSWRKSPIHQIKSTGPIRAPLSSAR